MAAYRHRFRVHFDNVDYARVLYFPRQIDFYVEALEEFLIQVAGISVREMMDRHGVVWPTVHIRVDYQLPLEFEELADLHVFVRRIGTTSVTFGYEVYRASDGALTSRATHVVVMVDMKTGQSIPVPPRFREVLARFIEPEATGGLPAD